MQSSHNKTITMVGLLTLLLVILFIWHEIRSQLTRKNLAIVNAQAIMVEVSTVKSQVWHPQIEAVGTILADQGIEVSTQVDAVVKTINFKSGDFVEQGTLLVQLDSAVLQATVANNEAALKVANADYERKAQLFKRHAISKADLDQALGAMQEAKATLQQTQASLAQMAVSAPFSGKLGLRQVSLGQFVPKGTVIVSLQAIDPVLLDFSLPETYLSQVKVGDEVSVTTSSFPNQLFTGKIIALNSALDSATRTLQMRAELPNKNKLLMPGMFADIQVIVPSTKNVLTVPQMAIQYSPFGNTVFVVQNGKAVQRYVTVGEQRGADMEITRGLSDNETVVSVGGNKLQNGTAVITKEQQEAMKKASAENKIANSENKTSNATKRTKS
jgi:membrane fusion protein (multidrug efflux system)